MTKGGMRAFVFSALLPLIVISSAFANPVVIERLEASVNSTLILLSDVSRFRQTEKLRAQLDPLFAGTAVASKGPNASAEEIVDFLVNERLIAQAFPVSDSEVEQEISGIQSNNHLDRAQLKRAIEDQGFTFDEYFELIRISASKRNLIDRDIRTKVTISDDDVKNYYFNHYTHDNTAPSSYDISIISISNKSYKSLAAAKETANKAAKQLKEGESFDEVAKRLSDDASASAGGDLGTVTDDQMNPDLRAAVKKMKVGETSPVVQTKSGFAILKLKNIQAGNSERYEKMKEEIRNQLAAGEYQHQIQLWLERQRQTAFIHLAGQNTYSTTPVPGGPSH
jgi:peptidyl-prolyl cis-trans isomerase SurA